MRAGPVAARLNAARNQPDGDVHMNYLLVQIFLYLLIAAFIGAVAAWFLRRGVARRQEAETRNRWADRLHSTESFHAKEIETLQTEAADERQLLQAQLFERDDRIKAFEAQVPMLKSKADDDDDVRSDEDCCVLD